MSNDLILPNAELIHATGAPALLEKIRPHWQAKSLIHRVRRLIEVDPSSACQRLLNAAIHDLRDKVVIAGVDIAEEAAKQNNLPPVSKQEDVENYSTRRLIDLAYRMGLLTRPEWRRVCRCYEIRRDLEHEDDEYEAGVEDCVYIFKTCIEVILAVDPVDVLKVNDVKELIEQATIAVPDASLIEDYERAPRPRQEEILKFLISIACDRDQSDIVQQNAYACLTYLRPHTHANVLTSIGTHLQEKVRQIGLDDRYARVAIAAGVFPYLRLSARKAYYEWWLSEMEQVGTRWTAHERHGELLRDFNESGGLGLCPKQVRPPLVKWLAVAYIGEPGGRTSYGNVRHVFYSNSAAPLIKEIFGGAPSEVIEDLEALRQDQDVLAAVANAHVARRFEALIDLFENE